MRFSAKGRLRHRFFGHYSARIAFLCESPEAADSLISWLNTRLKPLQPYQDACGRLKQSGVFKSVQNSVVLLDLDGSDLEHVKDILEQAGADRKSIDSLKRSIDLGEEFEISWDSEEKKPFLIGLHGLAGAGKTQVADFIQELSEFEKLSFARPLKDMLATLLGEPVSDKTACPEVLCGKDVRYALQTLGTGWGREMIDPEIWVKATMLRVEQLRETQGVSVVIDDVRFTNEAEAIKRAGGHVVEISRSGLKRMDHPSEAGIPADLVDYFIHNDVSLVELKEIVLEWMKSKQIPIREA